MKKFACKVLIMGLISLFVILAYCQLAFVASLEYKGINTEEQIRKSFDNAVEGDYNCYVLGNSRVYRGVNPDMFTSARVYNFAHDNDSYNQMYYKLRYLLENGKQIDYLIIGTDYFQFSFLSDTRNYVYSALLPDKYSDDFGNKNWLDKERDYYITVWKNKQNAFKECVKFILNEPRPLRVNYMKDNGQYIVDGNAKSNQRIKRDYSVLEIQYDYFKRIISMCEKHGIKLYVIMPPLWEGETSSHTEQERRIFNEMIRGELSNTPYKNNYINYSEINGLSSYEDFIDVTHLKPEAADRYSAYISRMIFNND